MYTTPMKTDFEIAIIGAGCIGLAIAETLSKDNNSIVIIDKNENFGEGISSRNSEVIHSGIYYEEGTLKSKLCTEGQKAIYKLGAEKKIDCKKTGKLIVATDVKDLSRLDELYENGITTGIEGLKLLTAREVNKIEPNVQCKAALLSRETGILSAWSLMKHLYKSILDNDVTIAFKTKFIKGEKLSSGYRIFVTEADGTDFSFTSKIVINATGLYSDKVAESFAIDIEKSGYKLNFAKGSYVGYSGPSLKVKRLIYPVPSPSYLGIHSVIDTGGRYRFGPDILFMKKEKEDYSIAEDFIPEFYKTIIKYFPQIKEEDLYPDFCGIRPKRSGPGEKSKDFVINEESSINLPGLINLIGIESPGLTSCLAIGNYVKELLNFQKQD